MNFRLILYIHLFLVFVHCQVESPLRAQESDIGSTGRKLVVLISGFQSGCIRGADSGHGQARQW